MPTSLMKPDLRIRLISFGWKGNDRPSADLYLDCRAMHNPALHSTATLSSTGDDPKMIQWVMEDEDNIRLAQAFVQVINIALKQIMDRRRGEEKPYARPFTVACACAYGVHRSRSMKHTIGYALKAQGLDVVIDWAER